MKLKLILLLLFVVSENLNAQPGDMFKNLNSMGSSSFNKIIIDSTSQLKFIERLRNEKKLDLSISLDSFPPEFHNFTKTEILQIYFDPRKNINNISFIDNFPNLKELTIRYYKGEKISYNIKTLTKLNYIWIDNAENLNNIDAIADKGNLEKIYIKNCPSLINFPKFNTDNQLKTLHLSQLGETFSIKNLNSLKQLENLTLVNIFSLKEIPNDLSDSLKLLEISTVFINKQSDHILELNNIDNLIFYPNLKEIKFQRVVLIKINCNFSNLSINKFELTDIGQLIDISGLFTFKKAKKISIQNTKTLKNIKPIKFDSNIEFFLIENAPKIENINKLLKCQNIRFLQLKNVENLKIPHSSKLSKFKIVSIFNKNFSLRIESN